jgi:tungstate transport system substrate-binding protein
MKKIFSMVLSTALVIGILSGCGKVAEEKKEITLATTTRTRDSGLLDYLLPEFTKDTGYKVNVVAVGTGQALKLGQDGNADVVLVHSKPDEEKFVAEGYGIKRYQVMYNDFIIVGPESDPAGIKNAKTAAQALKMISEKKATFISRGDDSGTHKFEKRLWKAEKIEPKGDWYISAGRGMGEVLNMADEKKAYAIADRGTYLSMKDKLSLKIIFEKSGDLKNQYGVIAVSPKKYPKINAKGAEAFINWLLSDKGQKEIESYGKEKYGQSLFIPNANK